MTKEELEKEANKWADDMVWALVDMKRKANDDERDFLVQEYKDLQKRFTKELKAQIEKMKLCNICKHYQWESCNYHLLSEKDCKANNHSLFELVGDKRK